MMDLSDTIVAKSNQLNAEDLISAERTIKITGVKKYVENGVSKFDLSYEGDQGRVYKPSKGMRVVITSGWGMDGDNFVGKYIRLYYDPEPVFGGKEVGGIRINGMSNLPDKMTVRITERRGHKKTYVINVLDVAPKQQYPEAHFNKVFPAMEAKVISGDMTREQVINKCEATGFLSDAQKNMIRDIGKVDEIANTSNIELPDDSVQPSKSSSDIDDILDI